MHLANPLPKSSPGKGEVRSVPALATEHNIETTTTAIASLNALIRLSSIAARPHGIPGSLHPDCLLGPWLGAPEPDPCPRHVRMSLKAGGGTVNWTLV